MDYQTLAFILALAGFALITAELFVPSGGLISVLCIVSFVASLWCAYRGWWIDSRGVFWAFAGSLFVAIPVFVGTLFHLLETTHLGDRILLSGPSLQEVTPYQSEQQKLETLIGRRGRTLSMLNPGGMVNIDGERLHAFSEGVIIEPEEWVEVLEVRGARVLVRRSSAPAAPHSTTTAVPDEDLAQADDGDDLNPPAPLDFDLPRG